MRVTKVMGDGVIKVGRRVLHLVFDVDCLFKPKKLLHYSVMILLQAFLRKQPFDAGTAVLFCDAPSKVRGTAKTTAQQFQTTGATQHK